VGIKDYPTRICYGCESDVQATGEQEAAPGAPSKRQAGQMFKTASHIKCVTTASHVTGTNSEKLAYVVTL